MVSSISKWNPCPSNEHQPSTPLDADKRLTPIPRCYWMLKRSNSHCHNHNRGKWAPKHRDRINLPDYSCWTRRWYFLPERSVYRHCVEFRALQPGHNHCDSRPELPYTSICDHRDGDEDCYCPIQLSKHFACWPMRVSYSAEICSI
jgi:hypothetical protein